LDPVPIVIVPDALISNAPPPAPAALLLLKPPSPPEQPPRSGSRSESLLTAPADPAVPLWPLPPFPPAVPKPPPPPPGPSLFDDVVGAPPVCPLHWFAMLPPGPAVFPAAPASILPPESTITLPATRRTMGLSPLSFRTWFVVMLSDLRRTTRTVGPPEPSCATSFVKSSVPRLQLVLEILPAPEESMVVVPEALQFHDGDDWKLHCDVSTLTAGGLSTPLDSQPFCALPSQSTLPEPHVAHAPDEHVWLIEHELVLQVVPQLVSVSIALSQPFMPSQSRNPDGQSTHAPPEHDWVFAVHGTPVPHWPLDEQVWTELFEHCVVFGVQTPAQAPLTQADDTHVDGLPH